MCGIVGYTGPREAGPILMEGLRRLEYRGYDSAGIALVDEAGDLFVEKRAGKLANLTTAIADRTPHAAIGLAHTRWATHGRPNDLNAHPHQDCTGAITVIHNGIIENFRELRDGLEARGHTLTSETDTEAIAHLVEEAYKGDLADAVRAALRQLEGAYAIVVMHKGEISRLVGARQDVPLIVGRNGEESFIASDVSAILAHTRRIVFLEEGDVADVLPTGVEVTDVNGVRRDRAETIITWTPEAAEKGGFDHFMLKEIHEIPRVVRETLLSRLGITPPLVKLEKTPGAAAWSKLPRVRILACGSSYHAGLIGKHLIESLAGIPCEATLAPEYRHGPAIEERGTLAVAITQSGETADTLGALREAKRRGLPTLAICNVEGSTATREADWTLLTRAGPEIGVASTKTYLAQLSALALLAIHLGEAAHHADPRLLRNAANHLKKSPYDLDLVLQRREAIQALAAKIQKAHSVFFLGRGPNQSTAFEAALKLKEIAYQHAEGYSMGELKHGPFAMLTKKTPVIAFLVPDALQEKTIGTLLEVRSRDAPVYGFCLGPAEPWKDYCTDVVSLPEADPLLGPMIFAAASHLLSYEVAKLRGHPIDRPRNLAKSVTVE